MSVTLKELAEFSGCSIRTVSRVLSGTGPVSPDKRELITGLARKYHYVPNMAARNLRKARRCGVGLITAGAPLENGIFTRRINDLTARLQTMDLFPLLGRFSSCGGNLTATLQDWSGLADCIFLFNPSPSDFAEIEENISRFPFRFAAIDTETELYPEILKLRIDRSAGIIDGIQQFVELGHRRILRVGNIATRDAGWKLAKKKFPGIAYLHFHEVSEQENCELIGTEILDSGADAVFFDTDRGASGFIRYATKNRIHLPERISVAGFDDEPFCSILAPALSSVAHPLEELNLAAAAIASGNEAPPVQTFPTRFVCRESITAR